ncbi:ABC transporter substrate-binding protein [Pseudothermotoga sp.]|uniref:ABC transporter substrate-binding protein n=1 Tax=Pseudothermotoga sp. TaxID=2033661 RepID=UPI002584B4E0|nr:extracellular solute-binding protein [Pseudothermotoga sp.]MDK2883977.1 raffinose/stachyose/melibiose transport system substrate-binding protein [Pseudothermotoga sp.]
MKSKLFMIFLLIVAVLATAGEVTIWSWRSQDAEVWKQVEAELRKAGYDIKINFTAYAPTEYDAKIALALQTGTGPDIVYSRRLPGGRTQTMIENKLYLPLNDYVDFSNFSSTILKSVTHEGKIYGIPFAVQVVGIFYNKEYYEKYGLKEPETWDELVENAKVLKKNGITPFFIPGKEAWALTMQHAMCGVSVLGPEWIKKLTDGETNFLDPKFTDLNKKLNDLKAYYQDGFLANSTTDQDAAFAFGQAAMVFYGIWGYQNWKNLNPDIQVGYFMVPPATKDQKPYAYVYMDGAITLTSNVKNKKDAIEVLKFCATPQFGTIFANITKNIPGVSGATLPKEPLFEEIMDVYVNHASPYVYWVGSVFVTQKPSLYDDVLSPGMQELYAGKITPEELSKRAQDAISQWYPPLMKK